MKKTKKIVLLLLLALFVVSACFNVHLYKSKGLYKNVEKITFVDTIPYYKPIPKDSTVIKYISVRLPEDNCEDIVMSADNDIDSKQDSIAVQIPIIQKVYENSNYTAYISGYNPSLDSLILKMSRELITIKEYSKPKRWNVGIQAGYGLTLSRQLHIAPYVGIGISYNLFSF